MRWRHAAEIRPRAEAPALLFQTSFNSTMPML